MDTCGVDKEDLQEFIDENVLYFDLDGGLVDSREHHFVALNRALESISPEYVISKKEHLQHFDVRDGRSR